MSKLYQLAIGLTVRRGERVFKFSHQLSAETPTYIFQDEVTGEPVKYTLSEVARLIDKGEMQIVSGEEVDNASDREKRLGLMAPTATAPHDEQELRKYRYVMAARYAGLSRGARKGVVALLARLNGMMPRVGEGKEERDPSPPSDSTVLRWLRKYQDSGDSKLGLTSGYKLRRQPKRVSKEVIALCRSAIAKHYLNQQRRSIRYTHEQVQAEIKKLIKLGELAREKAAISESTTRRLILEIDPYYRDLKRFGAHHANKNYRYSLSGARARFPLMRYEIDHTVIDIVVVCDLSGMPLGRPTLTLVVDACSGYIVGFFISFWGTGLASVLAALKVSILPKDDLTQALGLKARWIAYGIPMLFVVDNGMEFHAVDFMRAAMMLGTNVEFCGTRRPWHKPFVERTIGELMHQLPAEGRVFKPKTNYLPPSPDKTACITFSRLCSLLVSNIVNVHANEIDDIRLTTAFQEHSDGLANMLPPRLPSSTKELELIAARNKFDVNVSHDGVVLNWLRYRSIELANLRKATAANFKTCIKFNPEDLGHIYVQDPISKGWLTVPCSHPKYANGLSVVQHAAVRQHKKDVLKARNAPEILMQGREELARDYADAVRHGKKLSKLAMRATYGLTSSRSFLAAIQGGAEVPKPEVVVGGNQRPTEEDTRVEVFDVL